MTNPAIRQQKILAFVREYGEATISQLCELFAASPATIQRDLHILEEDGCLRRLRGGAALTSVQVNGIGDSSSFSGIKDRIAKAAVQIPDDQAMVFLGPGTTTLAVANYLPARPDLTVLVSSPRHALLLTRHNFPTIWVLSGRLYPENGCILGSLAEDMLRRLRIDIAIIGCNALCPTRGILFSSTEVATLLRVAVAQSGRVVVVADHTKFEISTSGPFISFDHIDLLVTDGATDPDIIASIERAGVEVRLV